MSRLMEMSRIKRTARAFAGWSRSPQQIARVEVASMHSLSSFVSLAAVGIIVLAGTASAQPRPLYVTDGSGPSTRYAIQGGVVTNSFGPSGGCDYGIAVSSGKVSTLQTITGCGSAGNQYTLGGTLIGPAAVNNSPVD